MSAPWRIVCVLVLVASTACVAAPRAEYAPNEIRALDHLPEVMRVMYRDLDPVWPLADRSDPGEAEFFLASTSAERTAAAAEAILGPAGAGRPDGFRAHAERLGLQAEALGSAAAAADTARLRAAVTALGETCEACHAEF